MAASREAARTASRQASRLVKEKIAQSGVDLLKKEFDVDVRLDMDQDQLLKEIKELQRHHHPQLPPR